MLFLSDDTDWIARLRAGAGEQPRIIGDVGGVTGTLRARADAGVDEPVIPDFNPGPMNAKLPVLDRFIAEVVPGAAVR